MILRQPLTVGLLRYVLAVFCLMVLFSLTHAAIAQPKWQHVMTFDGTKSLHVDLASPRQDGELVTMRNMFVFEPSVDLNGIDASSTRELWAYDCSGLRRAIVDFVVQDINGVDHVWNPPTSVRSRLQSVADDLTGAILIDIACNYAG